MLTDKDIDRLVGNLESNLADHLDEDLYLPVKKELTGKTEHSLGFRKEIFKEYVASELEKLKKDLKRLNGS